MYHATAEYQLTLGMFKLPNLLAILQKSVHQVPVALGSVSVPGCSSAWFLTWAQPCLSPCSVEAQWPQDMVYARLGLSKVSCSGHCLTCLSWSCLVLSCLVCVSVFISEPGHWQIRVSQGTASPAFVFMCFKPVLSTFHNCTQASRLWALFGV